MKYLHPDGFSVVVGSKEYRDNYDAMDWGDKPKTHWPDCAVNHGGTECDMGPECGTEPKLEDDTDCIAFKMRTWANVQPVVNAIVKPITAPDEPCDVCGAPAGTWCESDCSECPEPTK